MKENRMKCFWILAVLAAGMLIMIGCVKQAPKPGETFSCAKEKDITKTIAKEASLEKFFCVIKKWKGQNTLHFMVGVKNISNEDQRFKINIFLENGKAVGGLLPRKTKGGLMKPGQTMEFVYPVKGVDCYPGKIDLFIKTMSK